MDEKLIKLASLRTREHGLIQQLVKVDAEICALMRELYSDHAPSLGLSDVTANAVTAPKD